MRFLNRVSLATPESVEIEFPLAGIGNRALALVIDYHILGLILVLFWVFCAFFILGTLGVLERIGGNYSAAPLWLLAIAVLLNFAVFAGYFVLFEAFWQGQTPGKRLTKIRVIQNDGRPVGLTQAALRGLLRPVDDFFFIGIFFIVLSKQEKRIGDWVAGTLVVQEGRSDRRSPRLNTSDAATQLAEELPAISDLNQLLPDDFTVLREYLQRRALMAPRAKSDLSMKLARQLRTLIKMETIPDNTTSEVFLEAVYLAYQRHFSAEPVDGSQH